MTKIPMTAEGFSRLEEELKHLKSIERPAVIRAIADTLESDASMLEEVKARAARDKS